MIRVVVRSLFGLSVCVSGSLLAPLTSALAAGPPTTIPSCQYTSDNSHPLPFCSTGQTAAVALSANTTAMYTFNYPGDNSNITFSASIAPIDPSGYSAVGFNVFDTSSKATPPPPVEVVTIASNGVSTDAHSMQFNYSSGTPGPVSLQLFNYTPNAVTFNLSDSGLMLNTGTGAVTTPVTLQLGFAPATSSGPSAPATGAPVSPAPAHQAPGVPSTINSCQYTSDNTHALPFCSTGATSAVSVPANGSVLYRFNYPGDNSDITFTAALSPVDPTITQAAGVNVFDTSSRTTPPPPVEVATLSSNGISIDPNSMQFNYSSGNSGPVTLQFFNYAPKPVTFNLSDSGLMLSTSNGTVTTPVTLQLS